MNYTKNILHTRFHPYFEVTQLHSIFANLFILVTKHITFQINLWQEIKNPIQSSKKY
jgi:hypothetical protein